MKFTAAAGALLLSTAFAAPIAERQTAITDVDILQFALTLEHLENVFYKQGISMMPESAFLAAGFSKDYYSNLKYIVHDEELHVQLLTSAIASTGAKPVAACTYDFPFKDPKSFVTLSSVLEGVGTSAYLGGAPLIKDKDYLAVAAAILVTESLHTSLQRFNLGEIHAANPYGTALGLNPVYTLAAAFIKSCPSSNAALPVKAFPSLMATQGVPTSEGISFTFSVTGSLPSSFFVTFVSGLSTTSVAATAKGSMITTMVPPTAMGQVYAFVTSTNVTGPLTDASILYGPAILEVTPPSPTFDIMQQ